MWLIWEQTGGTQADGGGVLSVVFLPCAVRWCGVGGRACVFVCGCVGPLPLDESMCIVAIVQYTVGHSVLWSLNTLGICAGYFLPFSNGVCSGAASDVDGDRVSEADLGEDESGEVR